MPGCRRTKKTYIPEDVYRPSQNSLTRTSENGLRNYGNALDDRTKQVFYRSVPENIMKETIYGQRYYNQPHLQNSNMSMKNEMDTYRPVRGSIPESVRDPAYGQRYYSQQRSPQGQNLSIRRELDTNYSEYEYNKPINNYKEVSSYSRPYQRTENADNIRPVYSYNVDDMPNGGNIRETYQPRYNSPFPSRSNPPTSTLVESRNIRETYQPRYNSPYPSRSNPPNDLLPEPSSISNNGNTYSYSAPHRQNVEIVYADGRQSRYID
ncbi:unnamed protein product [Trichobilharzia szidati]|nr:unnamed protein product [Trichobilharzia szidati]